jgi:hypothetical protein
VTTAAQETSDSGLTGTASTAGTATGTTEETAEELSLLAWLLDVVFDSYTARGALVGRRGSSSTHERTHHNRGVDFAVALSAAKGTGLAASDLAVSDDGSVRLGATSARSLLVRSLRAN